MIEIGKMNRLIVSKTEGYSTYLNGGGSGNILLKERRASNKYREGDELNVFVYVDKEQNLVASPQKPRAMVGEFATMKVVSTSTAGAFLKWGLDDDLLVPKSEQLHEMKEGESHVVYVFISSKSNRITASSKVSQFLDLQLANYDEGEAVELLVTSRTKLGYNAIVNRLHSGIIYNNEIFQKIAIGQRLQGYVKKIREDGKIDLLLQETGYHVVDDISQKILGVIEKADGVVAVTDKSAPEEIYEMFGVSKKVFKKAIGALYKKKLVTLDRDAIRLAK